MGYRPSLKHLEEFRKKKSSSELVKPDATVVSNSTEQKPAAAIKLFNPKFTNTVKTFINKEGVLFNLVNENPNKSSFIDKIDARYKNEIQQDLRHLHNIEKNYLSTKNKSKLEASIQHLDKLYYAKYKPLDNFTSFKEYTLYSVSLLFIAFSIMMIVNSAIKRMLKPNNDLNKKRTDVSVDKSINLNINSKHLKKGSYSFILAFLICSLLQFSKLNSFKQQYYKHFFYENVSSINNINYYNSNLNDEVQNISSDLNTTTYFDNDIKISENLYKIKSSWKGIYIEDFYDFKFEVIGLILQNTLIDYFYWVLISTIILFVYFIYKRYLKRLKINIS